MTMTGRHGSHNLEGRGKRRLFCVPDLTCRPSIWLWSSALESIEPTLCPLTTINHNLFKELAFSESQTRALPHIYRLQTQATVDHQWVYWVCSSVHYCSLKSFTDRCVQNYFCYQLKTLIGVRTFTSIKRAARDRNKLTNTLIKKLKIALHFQNK